ncbi:mutagen-sensitive 301 [Nomia melanderi]|uniref:mutagen-sensitive 301 n=1 Tax=Nomia melanderi TaxID=2448451 RepID=UPI001304779E|nr:helicase POLQ-like [Nomia melanderi]
MLCIVSPVKFIYVDRLQIKKVILCDIKYLYYKQCHNEESYIKKKPKIKIQRIKMGDTILKNIETENENSEIPSISPNVHEQTLNNFAHEWSSCDIFESYEKFERPTSVDNNDLGVRSDKNNVLNSSCKINEENNMWQDESFLNAAFTQSIPFNEKNDVVDCLTQVSTSQYENHFEETFFTTDVHYMCASPNEQKDTNVLKRNVFDYKSGIPNKIHCSEKKEIKKQYSDTLNTSSKENCTFYGLPNSVKDLFLRIRGINKLYEWQNECLTLDAIKSRKNLIYALPTSGGKTLVAEILMLKELICNKKNTIFILPFVAIVQEKVQAMTPFALELNFLVEEYAGVRGTYPPKKRRKKNSIYMCTIEKALSLIHSLIEENRFNEIGVIVVDELHLLGEGGGRGATLEVLLTKTLYVNENIQIIGMSATIGNLEEIAKFLNADLYTGNFRPVEIKEYVKCEDNIWLVDLKTEDLLTDLKKINYRYSNDAIIIDPDRIGGLVMDVIPQDSCLIFCSSRKNCENVALLLSRVLFRSLEKHKQDEKENLLKALQTEEGLCPILQRTIKFGVAYHHSGLTTEERRFLEDAFRAGTLCVLCCTTTLAAGVNLPARRVILRSPYVGNQFLNLSRYKQMIGRAGRAGMGSIGESILLCKNNELSKVKELLMSKMDDSLSTLHIDRDRGINNLILSATLYSIANTRSELHKITNRTLLNIQQKRLNVNVKHTADQAITEFLKSGVMKVKKKGNCYDVYKPNVTVTIPSQNECPTDTTTQIKRKTTIALLSETKLELCSLGRAALKGNIDIQSAYTLYQDLQKAQEHLILVDDLHLLYLVTPYDIVSQIKPIGSVYCDVVTNLSENQMKTARLLGINEATVVKIRDGIMPKNVELRVIQRFYVTLILYDLWTHHAVYILAEKYQVNRGIIQNLLTAVSSFASSVVRFCQELDEFWSFRDLLSAFSKRLSYCCPLELEALMELPLVKIGRARQLYNAGYKTIQCIAKVKPKYLQEKIPYLSKKAAIQIVEAAKLLILKKVEDLEDEVEYVREGIDLYTLKVH